jgi:hypothetical protein
MPVQRTLSVHGDPIRNDDPTFSSPSFFSSP